MQLSAIRRTRGFGRAVVIAGVAALCAAPLHLQGAAPQTQSARESRERHVFMTVFDKDDAPVTDLTISDVTVREDGVAREISHVGRSTAPMQIALLVDDSQIAQMPSELHQALTSFVQRIATASPDSEMSLMTFGERPTALVPSTRSAAELTRAIARLFPRTGAGAYMLEAIIEASKAFRKREAPHPVIVAFLVEDGPEFSNQSHDQVADALKSAGASLWTVVLQGRRSELSLEMHERATVIADVASNSGGGLKSVLDKQALNSGFTSMATFLTSQVDVTYARPDRLIPPTKLEVTVKRPGLRVWAPRWTGTTR